MKKFLLILIISLYSAVSFSQIAQVERLLDKAAQIAVVTYDFQSDNNLVVWFRVAEDSILNDPIYGSLVQDFQILNYNIYRYDTASTDYVLLGTANPDSISVFEDISSNPREMSYKYRITADIHYEVGVFPLVQAYDYTTNIDSCKYHKTLLIKKETLNNEMKVIIEPYKVENLDLQKILDNIEVLVYKNLDSSMVYSGLPYDTIPFNSTDSVVIYTDPDPDVFANVYFYGGAVQLSREINPSEFLDLGLLKASSGPFSQSISNIEDNRLRDDNVKGLYAIDNMEINPNPFVNYVNVGIGKSFNYEIYNSKGSILSIGYSENSRIENLGVLPSGVYLLVIKTENKIFSGKIVKK